MKTLLSFLSLLLCSSVLPAQNGASIEYKISSSRGANGTMKVNFSEFGSVSEFNMAAAQMPGAMSVKSLHKRSNPDVSYTINDKNKTYSENPYKENQAAEDTKKYTVKKLGEETVNGYKCVHAIVTEDSETHEVWNTKDIAAYASYMETFKSNKQISSQKREAALKAAGCDGLMVKAIHKGNEREGDVTIQLVNLEKKNFSQSDFEIPAGYTKQSSAANTISGIKSQEEIMKMSPEERQRYMEELKKAYGK
jgi:hypothetical protein